MAGDIGLHKRAERYHIADTGRDDRARNPAQTFLMIFFDKEKMSW